MLGKLTTRAGLATSILCAGLIIASAYFTTVSTIPPAWRYYLIIDAGPFKSCLYVYRFDPAQKEPRVTVAETSDGTRAIIEEAPGLSSFIADPQKAFDSIATLLKFAEEVVPDRLHDSTPLRIMGTATMRTLAHEQSAAIFDAVTDGVQRNFRFEFSRRDSRVISQKEEGAFAWAALNFANGKLEMPNERTFGTIVLGSDTLQVTFELKRGERAEARQKFNLLGRHLYSASFPGFGADVVRQRDLHNRLVKRAKKELDKTVQEPVVADDCLPRGYMARYGVEPGAAALALRIIDTAGGAPRLEPEPRSNFEAFDFTFIAEGSGDWRSCLRQLQPLLNQTRECALARDCSLNGVYQPALDFSDLTFYGFSEYWHTAQDLLGLGGKFDPSAFQHEAEAWCALPMATMEEKVRSGSLVSVGSSRTRNQCYKSAWMLLTLEGIGFPTSTHDFHLTTSTRSDSWTLGALVSEHPYMIFEEEIEVLPSFSNVVNKLFILAFVGTVLFYAHRMYNRASLEDSGTAFLEQYNAIGFTE